MAERLFEPISKLDLKELQRLALKEHEAFFKRNPYLKKAYHNSLIGIALCQGVASHYINPSVGINDFDIWLFYQKNQHINFWCRRRKSVENGYKGKRIDFLKRAINRDLYNLYPNEPDKCIIEYLLQRNTKTKRFLLKKAVVGLFPNKIFAKVIWKGGLSQ